MSWQDNLLFVLDGIKGHLVLWTDQLNNIVDVAISNPDSILVLYDSSNKIAKMSIKPLHLCVQELVSMKEWLQSCKVRRYLCQVIVKSFGICTKTLSVFGVIRISYKMLCPLVPYRALSVSLQLVTISNLAVDFRLR